MGKNKDKKKEPKEPNGEYGEIDLRAVENGYVIEARKLEARKPSDPFGALYIGGAPKKKDNGGFEEFIFSNLPEALEWIQENIAPTGKQREFLDALGGDEIQNPMPYDGTPNILNIPQQPTPSQPWTMPGGTGTGNIPQWTTVTANNTQCKSKISDELKNDLKALHGIDVDKDL